VYILFRFTILLFSHLDNEGISNKRNTLLLVSVYILPLLCSDKEESMVKRDVSPLVSSDSSLISSMTRPPLFTNKLRV